MTTKEEKAINRKRVHFIVNNFSINNAIKMLISEGFCVTNSSARRLWYQMRGFK